MPDDLNPEDSQIEPGSEDISDISTAVHSVQEGGTEEGDSEEHIDEITLIFDDTGRVLPSANQVADYQSRGDYLKDVCVWDFAAQVEKASKSSAKRKYRDQSEQENEEEAGGELNVEFFPVDDLDEVDSILKYSGRLRPKVALILNTFKPRLTSCVSDPQSPEGSLFQLVQQCRAGMLMILKRSMRDSCSFCSNRGDMQVICGARDNPGKKRI